MAFTIAHLKIILLTFMLTVVFVIVMTPIFVLHRMRVAELAAQFAQSRSEERRKRRFRERWVSRLSVFAAGVFVSIGVMDLFPDANEQLKDAATLYAWQLQNFPLPYFLMLVGFFLVLLIEQIVLHFKELKMRLVKRLHSQLSYHNYDCDGYEHQQDNNNANVEVNEQSPLLQARNSAVNIRVGNSDNEHQHNNNNSSNNDCNQKYLIANSLMSRSRRTRSLSDIQLNAASYANEGFNFPSIVGMRASPVVPIDDEDDDVDENEAAALANRIDEIANVDLDQVFTNSLQSDAASMQRHQSAATAPHAANQHSAHDAAFTNQSKARTILLVAAMSMHSLFEGLSLGLITKIENVATLFVAIILHKCIVAFSIGMQMSAAKLSFCTMLTSAIIFTCMSPFGTVIGMLVIDFVNSNPAKLVSGILQSLTSGTFLYVAFFEVLPHEFNNGKDRMGKLVALIVGFILVCLYIFIDSVKESA